MADLTLNQKVEIRDDPVPIRGKVVGFLEDALIEVEWDNGKTTQEHEDDLVPRKGGNR